MGLVNEKSQLRGNFSRFVFKKIFIWAEKHLTKIVTKNEKKRATTDDLKICNRRKHHGPNRRSMYQGLSELFENLWEKKAQAKKL
jgi:hypothetical protein